MSVWLTGLPGSGKTTIARLVIEKLDAQGIECTHLDGDIIRGHLWSDLGFSREDRDEHLARIIGIAAWRSVGSLSMPVCSFVSPYEDRRRKAKAAIPGCLMVWVNCPLHVCEARDPKGLYKKARAGELKGFTGIDAPYEDVDCADLVIYSHLESPDESAQRVFDALMERL